MLQSKYGKHLSVYVQYLVIFHPNEVIILRLLPGLLPG